MIRSAARDLQRLRLIISTIAKYGYHEFVRRKGKLPTGLRVDQLDSKTPPNADDAPRRFRLMLEELGPTFIKLGQVLSARPDLVSAPYIAQLKTLQDQCEPLPFSQIREAITDALGAPPEELFKELSETPLATASIAQVHSGLTKSGQKVVIKVQRPGIREEIRRDLDLLYRVAQLLNVVFEEVGIVEPSGVIREFDEAFMQELNFEREAANIREFSKLHKNRRDIRIPEVIDELSTSTALTLSFIEGTPLSRLPPDADKIRVANRIIQEAFEEVFIDGVFHADPHPGNLLYIRPGEYGMLDFGLLGRLTRPMQETLIVLTLAIVLKDAETVARTIYRMGSSRERISIAALRDDIEVLFEEYYGKSLINIPSQVLLSKLMATAVKHRIRIPAEYTMLAKAGTTIEGIVRELAPNLNITDIAKPYAEKLLMHRVAPDNIEGGLFRTLLHFQGLSQDFPLQASQIISDLSSGQFGVRVGGPSLEGISESLSSSAATLAIAIISASFFLGAILVLGSNPWTSQPAIVGLSSLIVGLLLGSVLILRTLIRPRLKKVSLARLLGKRR